MTYKSDIMGLLVNEHYTSERIMFSIKDNIESNKHPEKSAIKELITLFSYFANEIHWKREETILFPYFLKKGLKDNEAPLSILLAGHEMMRKQLKWCDVFINKEDYETFQITSSSLLEMIKAHGVLEYMVLFPIVYKQLSEIEKMELEGHGREFMEKKIGLSAYEEGIKRAGSLMGQLSNKQYNDSEKEIINFVKHSHGIIE